MDFKENYFMLGNIILALAMVVLLFMGKMWEEFGLGALALWVILVGLGVYLVMQDKSDSGNMPQ